MKHQEETDNYTGWCVFRATKYIRYLFYYILLNDNFQVDSCSQRASHANSTTENTVNLIDCWKMLLTLVTFP